MPSITPESPEASYLAERDFRLGRLIAHIGTCAYEAPGRSANVAFERLAHSVIEQMLSMKVGRTIYGRLAELCGSQVSRDTVQRLSVDEIRNCGMSWRKAETLKGLTTAFTDATLEGLWYLEDDGVRKVLTSAKGIGRWTADMFLIFTLDRPDVLPLEDGAIRQAFSWLYAVPLADATAQQLVCSLWHPYASLAVRYMYRALNQGVLAEGEAAEVLGF